MSFILISNDDGVHAEGLPPLVEAVASFGRVKVVVPLEDSSGSSNKLTLNRPLVPKTLANGYIAIPGTPTDCVLLACHGMFDEEPSFVVSGINAGANLGDDVLYSGTVAAALEGRHLKTSAIALSIASHQPQHYATAAEVARYLLSHWQDFALPQPCVLNVNVPDVPLAELKGFRLAQLGKRHRADKILPVKNPRGEPGYWIGLAGKARDDEPDSDFTAVAQGYVALTPISVDMTNHQVLPQVGQLAEHMNANLRDFKQGGQPENGAE